MKDRTGEVWAGVFLEDEGDVCLCVGLEYKRYDRVRWRWVDLESGEESSGSEGVGPGYQEAWEGLSGRRRLA